jgi:hypothetical protein
MDYSIFGDNIDPDKYSKYNRLLDDKPIENIHEVSDHEYRIEDGSSSTVRQRDFKLTLCEFENIAQRYDSSLPILQRVLETLDTKENMKVLRERVNQESEQVTLKVDITSLFKSRCQDRIETLIYKAKLHDIDKRAFLMLKADKDKISSFKSHIVNDSTYVFDRIKMQLNAKGEVVLSTTSATVFREEEDSDMSLELSPKQREYKSRTPLSVLANIEAAIQNQEEAEAGNK